MALSNTNPVWIWVMFLAWAFGLTLGVFSSSCESSRTYKAIYYRGRCEALGGQVVDDRCVAVKPLELKCRKCPGWFCL